MSFEYKFAPPHWKYVYRAGAGHEIHAPVFEVKTVDLPTGIPNEPIYVYRLADPQKICIMHERWVQFEPEGWHEMQEANGKLAAKAPEMFMILKEINELGYVDGISDKTWELINKVLKEAIEG